MNQGDGSSSKWTAKDRRDAVLAIATFAGWWVVLIVLELWVGRSQGRIIAIETMLSVYIVATPWALAGLLSTNQPKAPLS